MPHHSHTAQQTSEPPYSIRVTPASYDPGDVLTGACVLVCVTSPVRVCLFTLTRSVQGLLDVAVWWHEDLRGFAYSTAVGRPPTMTSIEGLKDKRRVIELEDL